ncbi:MAG: DUF6188 family protein [Planctomycetota bacterium]|jgi:hypothetical protein
MYGLPKDFDGTFLVGRTLEMVCFAQYQVFLHFDPEITITIESSFSYQSDQMISVPVKKSDLMNLLGISVKEVQGDKNGTLSLTFTNGEILKIYDNSEQYESYRIAYKGTEIIV